MKGLPIEHGRDLPWHHHPPAIGRGTFTSVEELITVIETYIDAWNDRCAVSAELSLARCHGRGRRSPTMPGGL